MRERRPCVYILSSGKCGTLYVGATSNILKRLHEHRTAPIDSFTSRHGICRLVWLEQHETMDTAIVREKRIKKWNRDWKLNLIERDNPEWLDLAIGLGFEPVERCAYGFPPARE